MPGIAFTVSSSVTTDHR
ncbi:hypothetical protein HU200_052854 [Digitaria exilis]|uniref:Uncharacterized protein n=1 Tax=Digitaria exilis TaxID=1010633 RepID=A0A835AKU2_9POAL|nr:hypothetical protein HU200_052854 [Digitaria exilis]